MGVCVVNVMKLTSFEYLTAASIQNSRIYDRGDDELHVTLFTDKTG
jgi:hypothetical protein